MSVVMADDSRDPVDILDKHEGFALVTLTVSGLLELGQQVIRDPQPSEPDHALVVGPKTKAVRRAMAKQARWVVAPPSG